MFFFTHERRWYNCGNIDIHWISYLPNGCRCRWWCHPYMYMYVLRCFSSHMRGDGITVVTSISIGYPTCPMDVDIDGVVTHIYIYTYWDGCLHMRGESKTVVGSITIGCRCRWWCHPYMYMYILRCFSSHMRGDGITVITSIYIGYPTCPMDVDIDGGVTHTCTCTYWDGCLHMRGDSITVVGSISIGYPTYPLDVDVDGGVTHICIYRYWDVFLHTWEAMV